jgi:hypothetical protein
MPRAGDDRDDVDRDDDDGGDGPHSRKIFGKIFGKERDTISSGLLRHFVARFTSARMAKQTTTPAGTRGKPREGMFVEERLRSVLPRASHESSGSA